MSYAHGSCRCLHVSIQGTIISVTNMNLHFTDITYLAVDKKLATAGVTALGLVASSYRAIIAQLAETISGLTIKTYAILVAVKSVVHTTGRMAAWLPSTMLLFVQTVRIARFLKKNKLMFQSAQLYYLGTTSLLKAYTVESDDDIQKSPFYLSKIYSFGTIGG